MGRQLHDRTIAVMTREPVDGAAAAGQNPDGFLPLVYRRVFRSGEMVYKKVKLECVYQ